MNSDESRASKLETGIGPVTDKILNSVLASLQSDDLKKKISNIVIDPVTDVIVLKMKPYMYAVIGLYIFIILLLFIVIYLLIRKRRV